MTTKRRSHKNKVRRVTAKERAVGVMAVFDEMFVPRETALSAIEKALQAHAREAVARYRRKQGPRTVILKPGRHFFGAPQRKAKRRG